VGVEPLDMLYQRREGERYARTRRGEIKWVSGGDRRRLTQRGKRFGKDEKRNEPVQTKRTAKVSAKRGQGYPQKREELVEYNGGNGQGSEE